MWSKFHILVFYGQSVGIVVLAIVNPSNDSANMVIYMLPAKDIGPETWLAGVDCLDSFAQIFFYRNPQERFTRAYNLMLTNAFNMSSPAAEIQAGFSKRINEAVTDTKEPLRQEFFQLRVVSDHMIYERAKYFGEILLSDNYVIVVDSVDRLKLIMRDYVSQMRSWNPGARFLVLFHNAQLRDKPWRVASQIFNDLMHKFYVHRVALIYANSSTDYNLLVNDYYSNVDCRILNVQSVGQCHNGSLYPNPGAVHASMSDYLYGFSPRNCTFEVCASIMAPFVETDCVLGIEMRILGFMRNRLNFQTNVNCSYDNRGDLDDNGEWNGLLGKLNENECDFIIGGFYPDNEVAENFWGSDCYLQDAYTWYIKKADVRPAWQAMLGIFETDTWICFIIVLWISWWFWFVLVKLLPEPIYYQQLSLTAINALGVSISVAIQERPLCVATRMFFLTLTIYSINVVATYTSKMIATFQDPGHLHQLDELHEVVAAGIPFGGHEESRDWFENEDDMWIFNGYNISDDFSPSPSNMLAVEKGKRCILSNRMFIMQNRHADEVYAFPHNVFTSSIQMIMKAGFPFIYEMNMIIRYMRDVGIFQKIDADFQYNNTYLNRITKMRPEFASPAIVLTTEHLKGPFFILIVGVIFASLTFLGELMIFRHCYFKPRREHGDKKQAQGKRYRKRRNKWQHQVHAAPSIRFTPVKRRKVL
ncbi:LOW QUALITY PROTEIN: uncharacterized protein Ir60a [Drosophila tropicalis]|uniref:LOW QUALITY PROTEIN: uncharacterized protein Ir60a n=1 Tax=Drosophila tropicalis TaxID=46794 RepID=UPI0035AB709A